MMNTTLDYTNTYPVVTQETSHAIEALSYARSGFRRILHDIVPLFYELEKKDISPREYNSMYANIQRQLGLVYPPKLERSNAEPLTQPVEDSVIRQCYALLAQVRGNDSVECKLLKHAWNLLDDIQNSYLRQMNEFQNDYYRRLAELGMFHMVQYAGEQDFQDRVIAHDRMYRRVNHARPLWKNMCAAMTNAFHTLEKGMKDKRITSRNVVEKVQEFIYNINCIIRNYRELLAKTPVANMYVTLPMLIDDTARAAERKYYEVGHWYPTEPQW